MSARWLNPDEERAWRAYRRMRALLDLRLSRDLAAQGLSDADYDVLSTLSDSPGHTMRIRELADWMLWSQSRLSHHLARMRKRDLITRIDVVEDGRGARVELTAEGWRVLLAAAPAHVTSVRENFVDLMTHSEIAALGALSSRVVDHLTHGTDGQEH
jgi:DNA-binding MarR family transcriptional regulator